jgi:hypothetical protein
MKRLILCFLFIFFACTTSELDRHSVDIEELDTEISWEHDDFKNDSMQSRVGLLAEEATVTPTTVIGGVDIVTITGSGFGDTPFRVTFGGAYQGFFISWTDTKIETWVPGAARPGQVIIARPDGVEIGANSINVKYGFTMWSYFDGTNWSRKRLVLPNTTEAMEIRVPAGNGLNKSNLQEAMNAWCAVIPGGINWSIGPDAPAGTIYGRDGISVAYLGDSPGCASAGTYGDYCSDNVYIAEHDLIFDGCTDVKTMIHELGHWLGIQHIYSAPSIMSPSGGSGIQAIDIEAVQFQMAWQKQQVACGQPTVLGSDCDQVQPELNTYYRDFDGDSFGDPNNSIEVEGPAPSGYVSNNEDCDDNNAAIHPLADEIYGNDVDENCDGIAEQDPDYVNQTRVQYNKKKKELKITINGNFSLSQVTINGVVYPLNLSGTQVIRNIILETGTYMLEFITTEGIEYNKQLKIKGKIK